MVPVIEILDPGPVQEPQRVQVGILVTAKPVGVDQLENADLLFFGLGYGGRGALGGGEPALVLGYVSELLSNISVWNIGSVVAWYTWKLVEITPPFFRNTVGILEVGFKQILNIGQIPTLQVRRPPQLLHYAFMHGTRSPLTGLRVSKRSPGLLGAGSVPLRDTVLPLRASNSGPQAAPSVFWRERCRNNQVVRCISIVRICPIARVGLSPFGQTLTQFMIPRQRNTLKGSSRLSRRSAVAVSRLSARKR